MHFPDVVDILGTGEPRSETIIHTWMLGDCDLTFKRNSALWETLLTVTEPDITFTFQLYEGQEARIALGNNVSYHRYFYQIPHKATEPFVNSAS